MMELTAKIQKALDFACLLHAGQVRKASIYGKLPYASHPLAVAWILNEFTDDEDVIAAALLHDVLEDVPGYGFDDMARDFGPRVAGIVRDVSEDKDPNVRTDKKATWQARKEKYIAHIAEDSREAMLVCAADKIHNMRTMIEAVRAMGDGVWEKFNSPADKRLWYYEEVFKALNTRLDSPIMGVYLKEMEEFRTIMK